MEIRVRSKMPLPESIDAEVIESANSTLGALAKTIDHVTVTLGGTNAGGSVRSEVRCRLKTQHEPIVADARAAEPEMAVYRALKKARRILSRRLSKERTRRQRHVLVRGGPALA